MGGSSNPHNPAVRGALLTLVKPLLSLHDCLITTQ